MSPDLLKKSLFVVVLAAIIGLHVTAAFALFLGVAFTLLVQNPFINWTRVLAQKSLMVAVVGLGAGMDLLVVGRVGLHGIGYTALTIGLTLALGYALGKTFKTKSDTSLLISVGTAICGGSAIAAVAAAIKARNEEVSVAMAIVFILNALALFMFPGIGHSFGLNQQQFGLWSALAVHDTSSVVGTAMQFGPEALQIGTTVKLARALWIVPVTFLIGFIYKGERGRAKIPWFIFGFVIVAAVVTWVPSLKSLGQSVAGASRQLLVITLFLIGSNLNKDSLKEIGIKPFLQGVILWIIVSVATGAAILGTWLRL